MYSSLHEFILNCSTQFYSLPFCEVTGKQKRHKQDLGETLTGSHKVTTPYELTFLDPVPWRSLCEEYLDAKDVRVDFCMIDAKGSRRIKSALPLTGLVFHLLSHTHLLLFCLPSSNTFFQIDELKNAIENDYFFEMFIDDLPMWGYLGEVSTLLHRCMQQRITTEVQF